MVISNVCPSIPNYVILNALKNINVIPVSDIAYLKAGINIEGYEHILSFRRQMFIKHEDTTNLPGSLPLLHIKPNLEYSLPKTESLAFYANPLATTLMQENKCQFLLTRILHRLCF